MKKNICLAACALLVGTLTITAQEQLNTTADEVRTVKYTIMERFESDMILTAVERERLKKERFEEIKSKIGILDTLDISERKREKLMEDLITDPFSPRLSKTLADIEYKEEK